MIRAFQKTDVIRNRKIYQLRKKGIAFSGIAKTVGLSRERVSQIYKKLEVLDKPKEEEYTGK